MKVLLATDGSECSLAAAISVAHRPWPDGTVFKVVGVEELVALEAPMAASPVASIYPANLLEELLAEAHTRAVNAVESTRKILQEAGFNVLEQAADSQRAIPARSFWLWLKTWPADLIVLGSHGRRGWDRFLMGSVAESVAVHAHCSVEVIQPRSVLKD